ncbi:hypothetical protein [Pseudonocardia acaciae]|uniref:hypothetical protein n=1 Tax=Pseudonocardia acaciae TaxID=551276 RepID=UPI00048F793A|nr:hypothetical protein [Pseudonocardia acaciae]
MLMLVLIVAVAACLAAGLLAGKMVLVWCALAASVIGALMLAYLLYAGRRIGAEEPDEDATLEVPPAPKPATPEPATPEPATPEPATPDPATEPEPERSAEPDAARAAKPDAEQTGEPKPEPVAETNTEPAAATNTETNTATNTPTATTDDDPGSPDMIVQVVPGRRRFHVDGCRLLAGKPAEEISLDEAREEGFTACTSCIPRREALLTPS